MQESQIGLVGDVGRHSVRFALTGGAPGQAPREERRYHTADHPTFTSALNAYLADTGLAGTALPSVLAVAGSARSDLINLTNSRWYLSMTAVESVLRARPRALNECQATALALTTLSARDIAAVGTHAARTPHAGGSYLVVAVGTGLGVAALVPGPAGPLVALPSEAGHMTFAAATQEEIRFAQHIPVRGHLSAEALLSANGVVAAYAALANHGQTVDQPEQVTRSIDRDPAATAAMRMFVGYLGSFVGDLVMAFGAWDGVYLTGPIVRALQAQISDPRFRHRVEAKDAFRRQLADVPIGIVTRPDLVLLGAATALHAPN